MEDIFIKAGCVSGSSNEIRLTDIAKLYQYYKGRLANLKSPFIEAGDVTNDGKVALNDVAKLYQFYKGRLALLN